MNVSNLTSSEIFELNKLWDRYGQSWTLTFMYRWRYRSLGCLFNTISFIMLRDKEFNGPMYDYLKVYTLNSAQVCFFMAFFFLVSTARVNAWSNFYITRAYNLLVYVLFVNTGYFYGTFLDIVITLDRISKLTAKFLLRVGLQGITCCFCSLLGGQFPVLFLFTPASRTFDVITEDGSVIYGFTIWFTGLTDFAKPTWAKQFSLSYTVSETCF